MSALDPITLGVVQSGLQQVCNEMDLAFVRSAFSPVISEGLDRSDGIYARRTASSSRKASWACLSSSAPCSSRPST